MRRDSDVRAVRGACRAVGSRVHLQPIVRDGRRKVRNRSRWQRLSIATFIYFYDAGQGDLEK